jgi:hypothetical protein
VAPLHETFHQVVALVGTFAISWIPGRRGFSSVFKFRTTLDVLPVLNKPPVGSPATRRKSSFSGDTQSTVGPLKYRKGDGSSCPVPPLPVRQSPQSFLLIQYRIRHVDDPRLDPRAEVDGLSNSLFADSHGKESLHDISHVGPVAGSLSIAGDGRGSPFIANRKSWE